MFAPALRARRVLASAVVTLTVLASTGCAAFSDDTDGVGLEDGLQVVAAFYPLQYLAQRVVGERADVVNLTTPGSEPHDLEIPPRQTAEIADADVVVHERGFQPAVDDAIRQNATGEVLDAASVADLEAKDPHFWQDPLRMAKVGDALADRLSEVDADHADEYATNAADLRSDLASLDSEYEQGLADCERTTVVVSHDAFEYLTKYGLDMEPIVGLSPGAEPTPADLARLQRLIRDEGVTTVFSERLLSPRLSESLARDAGVTTAVLDPIEGLSDETSSDDYLSLMRANLAALQKADGCR